MERNIKKDIRLNMDLSIDFSGKISEKDVSIESIQVHIYDEDLPLNFIDINKCVVHYFSTNNNEGINSRILFECRSDNVSDDPIYRFIGDVKSISVVLSGKEDIKPIAIPTCIFTVLEDNKEKTIHHMDNDSRYKSLMSINNTKNTEDTNIDSYAPISDDLSIINLSQIREALKKDLEIYDQIKKIIDESAQRNGEIDQDSIEEILNDINIAFVNAYFDGIAKLICTKTYDCISEDIPIPNHIEYFFNKFRKSINSNMLHFMLGERPTAVTFQTVVFEADKFYDYNDKRREFLLSSDSDNYINFESYCLDKKWHIFKKIYTIKEYCELVGKRCDLDDYSSLKEFASVFGSDSYRIIRDSELLTIATKYNTVPVQIGEKDIYFVKVDDKTKASDNIII